MLTDTKTEAARENLALKALAEFQDHRAECSKWADDEAQWVSAALVAAGFEPLSADDAARLGITQSAACPCVGFPPTWRTVDDFSAEEPDPCLLE
jgi:hypothetical protein